MVHRYVTQARTSCDPQLMQSQPNQAIRGTEATTHTRPPSSRPGTDLQTFWEKAPGRLLPEHRKRAGGGGKTSEGGGWEGKGCGLREGSPSKAIGGRWGRSKAHFGPDPHLGALEQGMLTTGSACFCKSIASTLEVLLHTLIFP